MALMEWEGTKPFDFKRWTGQNRWALDPGEYRRVILDGNTTGRVACPVCGGIGSLDDHEIDEQGNVTPSLVCPHPPCPFHANPVRLLEW